ncbi:Putative lumazine-binding [Ekhidna lutea]|uniref:Putative lumazine-binding n=1 Tax=Ekhidna lutea TaxID=447679 RepID=A0A239K5K1_EKHLU|nr:nuclear transport factor 2 family protein [Ekhidna lutea]SNT13271.1 Putative lumazine-binding [Ekhidna lutea]
MKSTTRITLMVVIAAIVSFSFIKSEEHIAEMEAVKKVVYDSYINGAFNELNAEAMEKGFHKDFSIFTPKGEEISKYPIADWIAGVKKKKANGYDQNDKKNIWDHNFANIDITGKAAQVKVELKNQGNHVYTDYLSLLKFDSGWKIVAKVYHKHEK